MVERSLTIRKSAFASDGATLYRVFIGKRDIGTVWFEHEAWNWESTMTGMTWACSTINSLSEAIDALLGSCNQPQFFRPADFGRKKG